ncbi:hypothetical protein AB1Y20_009881 [Prymnesium parvum]|uniref:Nucleotide-diphospho-sugar transferase domain-containing protein n=1 Tax=Prymnesium parvum TaxID=97485 RepID=A0AB34K5P5_PRYPA
MALAVPLAAAAALVTLFSSSYLLDQTSWKAREVSIEWSDPSQPSLNEYHGAAVHRETHGGSAHEPEPLSHSPVPSGGASPPLATPPALARFSARDFEGNFLVARREAVPQQASYRRQLLKSLLGMALLLDRTLILPAVLCNCRDVNLTVCDGPVAPPFDCPLLEALDARAWATSTRVRFRPPRFLLAEQPADFRRSHVRLLLPDGMDDGELKYALRSYGTTRLLEIQKAHASFCGWDTRMPGNTERMASFEEYADALLRTSDGAAKVSLHQCTHYRGGTGEVLQFTNIGQADERHLVTASRDRLPERVRNLPNGTHLMVTFATGSVATMALNWVATVRKAGVQDILLGALDQKMMDACAPHQVPCVLIEGGAVTKALAERKVGNVRSDPALYPKMSVLKVGFYRELLSFGFNVWACDADAIIINDPRPMMTMSPWTAADVAIATDCIDLPGDTRYPLLHCDFNTGLVFLRSNPTMLDFTDRWRETIANAKETRIRDQAAFNMMTHLRPMKQHKVNGVWLERIFEATDGGDGSIRLGVLPTAKYLNGHTFFVQHVHTLPNAPRAYTVHMTYQFAEGSKFAYGKRQRLRQAGLWLVDSDDYFNGRYVAVSEEGATLPVKPMGIDVDSRDAVKYHLAEAAHRLKVMRALLAIGKATARDVILPRMLCYCDFMWKEMKNCRVGGAETMRLPFDCPMDHVFDTPLFFENSLGVGVREPSFLQNARVPPNVSGSIAKIDLPKAQTDKQLLRALAPHSSAGVLEIRDAVDVFCGFEDAQTNEAFLRETQRLLTYRRTPFCMIEGSDNAPMFSNCCSPRKPGDKFFPCIHGFDGPSPLPQCGSS